MKSPSQIQHEVIVLIMKSLAGDASTTDLAELNQLIQSDPSMIPFVADILANEATLHWTIAGNHKGEIRKDLVTTIADSIVPELSVAGSETGGKVHACGDVSRPIPKRVAWFATWSGATAASLILAIGAALGSLITWQLVSQQQPHQLAAVGAQDQNRTVESTGYVGRVVNATSCRWSPDVTFSVRDNGVLRKGESLQLIEGIAEIQLNSPEGFANMRIEGPAGLVLTADHGCSLSHGKLVVEVTTIDANAKFEVDTPNGRVELPNDSSAGVSVDGRDISVHVFRGDGLAVTPWSTESEFPMSVFVKEGESVALVERADGKMDIEHGKSRASLFASQVSMYSDSLNISPRYVQEVRSLDPILYWRFEDEMDGNRRVQNEVSDTMSGTVYGAVRQGERNGNRFVEFGANSLIDTTLPRIEANEDFGSAIDSDYSLELWVKPNHYHLGTVVAFVTKEPIRGDAGLLESPHGLLLEIGGPRTTQTTIEQPGKIRFLHRSPPSGRLGGSTCFSACSYEPRIWQHVVLVKQGAAMRIYLNGELTGTSEDATPLATDLKLLIGQLDEWRGTRMYVGQLDELAIYPRALTSDQVRAHYELVRKAKTELPIEHDIGSPPKIDAI